MGWLNVLWIALLGVAAIYLWMIAPSHSRPKADALLNRLYAHRGLHDGERGVPENSLVAFSRAADAGYGIELDVQLTGDLVLVVHHDANTSRLCGKDAVIRDTRHEDLPKLPDGSAIPTFAEVLALVNGRVPLIVEIKPYGKATENAAATLQALRGYAGAYCVESFHPSAVRYFRKTAPGVLRGQLAMGGKRNPKEANVQAYIALKYLLVNVMGRPHFVAYSSAEDRNLSMWLMKRTYRPMLAALTLRSQAALQQAKSHYQMWIFERFTPDAGATTAAEPQTR